MGSNRPQLSIFNLITSTLLALTCHNFKTFPDFLYFNITIRYFESKNAGEATNTTSY